MAWRIHRERQRRERGVERLRGEERRGVRRTEKEWIDVTTDWSRKKQKMRQIEERKTVGVFELENHYRLDDYDNTSHCPLQFKNAPSLMAVLRQ